MKGLNVKMVLALLCSLVIFSTVTGLNDELTKYNLRGYNSESDEGQRHLSKVRLLNREILLSMQISYNVLTNIIFNFTNHSLDRAKVLASIQV